MNSILGIDISKQTFDVALLRENKFKHKKFRNNATGFKELTLWLLRFENAQLHACMEATSSYGEALAEYLLPQGIMSVL